MLLNGRMHEAPRNSVGKTVDSVGSSKSMRQNIAPKSRDMENAINGRTRKSCDLNFLLFTPVFYFALSSAPDCHWLGARPASSLSRRSWVGT